MLTQFQLAAKEGVSTTLSEHLFGGDEEQPNNDRKLIDGFLFFAKETQKMLIAIETNNIEMREIYNQQINENKRADQESKKFIRQ